MSWLDGTVADGHAFALCLTHDVDRPFKTYQGLYYALADRDPAHLLDLLPHRNPYWTFGRILATEADLGVRSSWYFLDEQSLFGDRPLSDLLDPAAWRLYAGRYDVTDPRIRELIAALDENGWEVGLHGSYESYRDATRLAREKERLEDVLGQEVVGGRQHYLNVDRPETWRRQRAIGLQYDATPGPSRSCGFHDGYEPLRPFDDDFVVFPVTVMDTMLPDPDDSPERAWRTCESLLAEARENTAVMSVLFHPRYFSDDFPGYTQLYRRLVERADAMDAWIGPIEPLYESLDPSQGASRASAQPNR